jgi:hypothetical protein
MVFHAAPIWHSGAAWPVGGLYPGGNGGTVEGDRTPVLLVDLDGVLFSFDHEHR